MPTFGLQKVERHQIVHFSKASFYCIDTEEKVKEVDVLETACGTPSQQGAIKEEEQKTKEQEQTPVQKPLVQQVRHRIY